MYPSCHSKTMTANIRIRMDVLDVYSVEWRCVNAYIHNTILLYFVIWALCTTYQQQSSSLKRFSLGSSENPHDTYILLDLPRAGHWQGDVQDMIQLGMQLAHQILLGPTTFLPFSTLCLVHRNWKQIKQTKKNNKNEIFNKRCKM